MRLADHMVWLKGGRVVEQGPLQQVLSNMDLAIAHEGEAASVMDTTMVEHDEKYHLTALDSRFGRLWVQPLDLEICEPVRVTIPARDVSLALAPEEKSSILNVWEAVVIDIAEAEPGQVMVKLCCPEQGGRQPLLARITTRSRDHLGLEVGSRVYARIKSVGLLE